MSAQGGLTPVGKLVSVLLILGLIMVGVVVVTKKDEPVPEPTPPTQPATAQTNGPKAKNGKPKTSEAVLSAEQLAELKTAIPPFPDVVPYEPKGQVLDVEISEYAGYAGLVVANGGLKGSDESPLFKKHGVKLNITLSEDEDWPSFHDGSLAAATTTVDVLAAYGRGFEVVVPVQIGFSRGADGIVVRSEVNRINRLKGRIVAASQFNEADFFIRFLAQEAGLEINMLPDLRTAPDPEKVNLVYCHDAFEAGELFLKDLQTGGDLIAGCVTWAPQTTEIAEQSGGKAKVLITNTNLLIVADVLVVNKPFAQKHPKMVAALTDAVLMGNKMVRDNPEPHLDLIAKSLGTQDSPWSRADAKSELTKVHLANLPENLAFFAGALDMAGSYESIFQSAVLAYGSELVKRPAPPEQFLDLQHLKALEAAGAYKGEKIAIAPIRMRTGASVESDPVLSKDITFYFQPNSSNLEMNNQDNLKNLANIEKLLRISPGSRVFLVGHVDDAKKEHFRKQGPDIFRQMTLDAVKLSQERAAEIKRRLLEKHQLAEARVQTLGRGWEEPVSTIEPEKNRRVEVQWFTVE